MDQIKEYSIDLTRKIDDTSNASEIETSNVSELETSNVSQIETSNVSEIETSNASEPETFDTWTIITDPLNNLKKSETIEYNNVNRIEILKDNINRTEIKNDSENVDDLSDGISIISDSESAGRSSPMPLYHSENYNNENVKNEFDNKTKEKPYELIRSSTSETNQQSFSQFGKSSNIDISDNRVKTCNQDISYQTNDLPLTEISTSSIFTTKNISIIFYLSASIAIIAFVGKMKYPEWGNTLEKEVITQRVNDLELQNNLLRAEIDILSKQVKYLNTESESHSKSFKSNTVNKHNDNDNKNYIKKEKIKVWAGNGKIERKEIPKEALKIPHSCDQSDSNFDDVCRDDSEYNIVDNKNSDVHSQQFEKNLDSNDNNEDDLKNIIIESIEKIIPVAVRENVPEYSDKFSDHNSKNNNKEKHKKHDKYNYQNHQQHHNNNDKDFNQSNKKIADNFHEKSETPNKKENYKNKAFREDFRKGEQHKEESTRNTNNDKLSDTNVRNKFDSSEKYNNKENYKHKDLRDDFENNSKEKYDKRYYKNKDLREDPENISKVKYDKRNKKKFDDPEKSDEYFKEKYDKHQNDDWHENMMKNREEYRKKHDEKWKSNNWYMDRASGREEARIFEKDQHKFKKIRRQ